MGFFDKLKDQASSLSGQLDQALDGTKQKSQLNSMRKQRADMVAQLGEGLLQQFRQGNVNAEELRAQAEQIMNLEAQILEVEREIEAQKQAAAQAKAQQPPQAQPSAPPPPPTGTAQSAPAPPAAPEQEAVTRCPSCGSELKEGSSFCPNCGASTGG